MAENKEELKCLLTLMRVKHIEMYMSCTFNLGDDKVFHNQKPLVIYQWIIGPNRRKMEIECGKPE